jgi:hypothetical protein
LLAGQVAAVEAEYLFSANGAFHFSLGQRPRIRTISDR